jgi:hypothetical protein
VLDRAPMQSSAMRPMRPAERPRASSVSRSVSSTRCPSSPRCRGTTTALRRPPSAGPGAFRLAPRTGPSSRAAGGGRCVGKHQGPRAGPKLARIAQAGCPLAPPRFADRGRSSRSRSDRFVERGDPAGPLEALADLRRTRRWPVTPDTGGYRPVCGRNRGYVFAPGRPQYWRNPAAHGGRSGHRVRSQEEVGT